jgi:hypothetical protein
MRIPIYESKLVKTVRFEPEELEKIEQILKIVQQKAAEVREDTPLEASVIRMLVRLGIEEFYRREEEASS